MPDGKDNLILKRTEDLFFLLQNSLTIDAKNTVWHLLELAKESYPVSKHPDDWEALLENLQKLILDFANENPESSEMKLLGIHQNAVELKNRSEKAKTGDEFVD
jgi:hypothetical protein